MQLFDWMLLQSSEVHFSEVEQQCITLQWSTATVHYIAMKYSNSALHFSEVEQQCITLQWSTATKSAAMLSNQLWLTAPPTGGAFLFLNPQAAEVFSFFYDLRPKTASFFFFHKLQKSKVVSVLFLFFLWSATRDKSNVLSFISFPINL